MALLLVVCYLLVVNQNGISSTLISSVSLGVAGLAAGALGASYLISLPAAGAELAAELLAGRLASPCMPFDPFLGMELDDRGDELSDTLAEGEVLELGDAYAIVEEHGGCIAVESQPGKGTAFFVHLPTKENHV